MEIIKLSRSTPNILINSCPEIHDAFMNGPEHLIEFFHGYTYSGNPMAAAAGLATLETYREDGLLTRPAALESHWCDALHSLRGPPHVIDIRATGMSGRAFAHELIERERIAVMPGESFGDAAAGHVRATLTCLTISWSRR